MGNSSAWCRDRQQLSCMTECTSTPLLGLAQELCPDYQPPPLHTYPELLPPAHPISLPLLWLPATQELTVLLQARTKTKATIHNALLPQWQDGSCLQVPMELRLSSL